MPSVVPYLAPGPQGMRYAAYVDPESSRRSSKLEHPSLDDTIVEPETREEMIRGRRVHAAPALAPHADRHHALDFLTGGCVAPGYVGSSDLLTRTGPQSQFAADTSIRREGIDPATGTRYLEELAFEIVNEQSLAHITERAQELSARGVRRVIAILVKQGEVREWSAELGDWLVLDPDGTFEDPTLVEPIVVRALLERAEGTRAVVRALDAKRDPAIVEIESRGLERGRAVALRSAIEALCEVLGIPFDEARRGQVSALDVTALQRIHDELRRGRRWPST